MRSATILSLMAVGASAALLPRQATSDDAGLSSAAQQAQKVKPEDVDISAVVDASLEQDAPKCAADCKVFNDQVLGNCKGKSLADCEKGLCNDELIPNYVKCENCFTTNKYQPANYSIAESGGVAFELAGLCGILFDYNAPLDPLGELIDPASGKKLKDFPRWQALKEELDGNSTSTNGTAAANGTANANGTKANGNGTATDSATPAASTSGSGALKAMAPIGVALLGAAVAALL